ncbi:MAG: C40 family peptidase [Actinomycetota bacterium]|nr:C40 family peptidase [Actinomycetota bacterium]
MADDQRKVAVGLAPVRAEPDGSSEQVTQLLQGESVTVVESNAGSWARIQTEYDYPGWVRADALGDAPGSREDCVACHDPIEAARHYLGSPYEWGGMTKLGIDCSGLVHMAYRATGRLMPRDADQQEAAADPVAESDLRYGDLVCFGRPTVHIAFWLGDGRILHATSREGLGVVEEPLENVGEEHVRFVRL